MNLEARELAHPNASEFGEPATILVAEDEVLIRFAIADFLVERGFKVHEVGNVAEAIAVLEANLDIDVVFTDIRMPGTMTGLDLARWVRVNRPGLAVLLTSGEIRKGEISTDAVVSAPFFEKPYDLNRVVAYICALTQAKSRNSTH